MSTQQFVFKLYFYFILPFFGGIAVAHVFHELFAYGLFLSALGGVAFVAIALSLSCLRLSGLVVETWKETWRAVSTGTVLIALIPAVYGVTFLLIDILGSYPTFPISIGGAILATVFAFAFLPHKGSTGSEPPPQRDVVLRGRPEGGYDEAVRRANEEARRRRPAP